MPTSLRRGYSMNQRQLVILLVVGAGLLNSCATGKRGPITGESQSGLEQKIHDFKLSGSEKRDYLYTLAEAYSQEGQPKLAIENFKLSLLEDPKSVGIRLRLAGEQLKLGLIRESLQITDEVLADVPSSGPAHILKGTLLASLKDYDKAIAEFEEAQVLEPDNTDVQTSLGALYAEVKNYKKAAQLFEGLANNKSYAQPEQAYYYLGRIYEEKADTQSLEQAKQAYTQCRRLKSNHFDATMSLVSLLIESKNTKEAAQILEDWVQKEGPSQKVVETLANLYLLLNDKTKAQTHLEWLEAQSEQSVEVKLRLALIYIENKNYQQASGYLENILEQAPDSDRVRFYLGIVYQELGEREKAIYHFGLVPHFSSFFVDAVVQASSELRENKEYEKAEKLLEKAISDKPMESQFVALYASLLDTQKKYEQSYQLLSKAKDQFTNSSTILFFYAISLDRNGQQDKAYLAMQDLVKEYPDHALALNYLSYSLAEKEKKLDEALKMAQKAQVLDPQNPYIMDTLGWVYFKLKQYKTAVTWLEKAFDIAKDEGVILEHLGDAYSQMGLTQKALVIYDMAQESFVAEVDKAKVEKKMTVLLTAGSMVLKTPVRAPASSSKSSTKETQE